MTGDVSESETKFTHRRNFSDIAVDFERSGVFIYVFRVPLSCLIGVPPPLFRLGYRLFTILVNLGKSLS